MSKEDYRAKIEKIDEDIGKLLKEGINAIRKIGMLKAKYGATVENTKRKEIIMNKIKISKETAGRIKIKFPYVPIFIPEIKKFHGYIWHLEGKYWTIPNNDENLDEIISAFGEEKIEIEM